MEMMYDLVPTKGDTYTVNESHILSRNIQRLKKNLFIFNVIDIPLKDFYEFTTKILWSWW